MKGVIHEIYYFVMTTLRIQICQAMRGAVRQSAASGQSGADVGFFNERERGKGRIDKGPELKFHTFGQEWDCFRESKRDRFGSHALIPKGE